MIACCKRCLYRIVRIIVTKWHFGGRKKAKRQQVSRGKVAPANIKAVNDFNDLNVCGVECLTFRLFAYLNIVTFLVAVSPSAEIMRILYNPGFQPSQLMVMRSSSVFSISVTSIPDALNICTIAMRCPSMKN